MERIPRGIYTQEFRSQAVRLGKVRKQEHKALMDEGNTALVKSKTCG